MSEDTQDKIPIRVLFDNLQETLEDMVGRVKALEEMKYDVKEAKRDLEEVETTAASAEKLVQELKVSVAFIAEDRAKGCPSCHNTKFNNTILYEVDKRRAEDNKLLVEQLNSILMKIRDLAYIANIAVGVSGVVGVTLIAAVIKKLLPMLF